MASRRFGKMHQVEQRHTGTEQLTVPSEMSSGLATLFLSFARTGYGRTWDITKPVPNANRHDREILLDPHHQ